MTISRLEFIHGVLTKLNMTQFSDIKQIPRPWPALITLMTAYLICSFSYATSITVKKIKGSQAVVEMSTPLEAGKTYNLETESLTLETNYSTQFKSRSNSVSLGFDLNFLNGPKTLDNNISFFAKYGWNHISFEFGPVLRASMYDKGFGTNISYLVGGYFDYNYADNKSPRDLVYGASVQAALGNKNYDSGGSAQLTYGQVALFLSWFINNSPVVLRTELGYQITKVTSAAAENTLSGVASQVYLMYYF